MKALELVAPGKFDVGERWIPETGPEEVLIRVRACGICGSDVHGMDGSTGRRIPPIIMGHEASGEVVALGEQVKSSKIGDRVTFDSTIYCGQCAYCLRGEINLCDSRQVVGVSCAEFRRSGAFAEFVVVPAHLVHRLPDELSFEAAALAEPVSVAMHAIRRSGIQRGQSALVIGAGMIGLLIAQVLQAQGIGSISVSDIDPEKVARAKEWVRLEPNPGESFDVVFDAVGIEVTLGQAVEKVRKGGTVVLVGNLAPNVNLALQAVVTREISLLGSCASRGEYPASLKLLASPEGKQIPASIITHYTTLEEAPDMFVRLRAGEKGMMKVIVRP